MERDGMYFLYRLGLRKRNEFCHIVIALFVFKPNGTAGF